MVTVRLEVDLPEGTIALLEWATRRLEERARLAPKVVHPSHETSLSPPPQTDWTRIPGVAAARTKIAAIKERRRRLNWALQCKLRVRSSVVKRLVREFDPEAPAAEPVDDREAFDATPFIAALVRFNRELEDAKHELRMAYRHRPRSEEDLEQIARARASRRCRRTLERANNPRARVKTWKRRPKGA